MSRAGGFTLLEVLVALAIVTLGMAAVLGTLSSSAETLSYLRDKSFAQWVALNRIATVRLSGQQPATGKSDGDIDFAGRSWHWRQEVVTTEVPGVERIDVKVRPADVKTSGEDTGWFTTVSGVWGDAVGAQNGYQPPWGSQQLGGTGPLQPGTTGGTQTPGVGTPTLTPTLTPSPRTSQPQPPPTSPGQNR